MNTIELLEQEHEDIERELIELELANCGEINYSNLTHTLKKLISIWNEHEEKEEKIFPIMKKERILVPVKTMQFEHRELRPHKQSIIQALESGNGTEIKGAVDKHLGIIIQKLREHINKEDDILYTIALSEFTSEEIDEMAKAGGIQI